MCRVFLVLSSKPESFQLRGSSNKVLFFSDTGIKDISSGVGRKVKDGKNKKTLDLQNS